MSPADDVTDEVTTTEDVDDDEEETDTGIKGTPTQLDSNPDMKESDSIMKFVEELSDGGSRKRIICGRS